MVEAPSEGYFKRSCIRFERGICFVVIPEKSIFEVIPKRVERIDTVTLVAATGFWHYGNVKMIFDYKSDADLIEQKLRTQLSEKKTDNSTSTV